MSLSLIRPLLRTGRLARGTIQAAKYSTICPPPKPKKNPKFEKIRLMQEKFQKDDGKPVFLKGGPKDVMLYRATLVLALIGLALDINLFVGYII